MPEAAVPPDTPFPPDAIVFDLDGVLVDSEHIWGVVEKQVVVKLGFSWDPSIRPLLHGKGPHEAAAVLSDVLGANLTAADVADRMAATSEELFAKGVPVNRGVEKLVAALHGRVPLAVATNSRRVLAEYALIGNGLDRWFDTVVTADDVEAAKPAPDPYLLACERLGARPRRSIAIEDSIPGVTSAKAAGLWVIGYIENAEEGVHGGHLGSTQITELADHVVTSIADLDPRTLIG